MVIKRICKSSKCGAIDQVRVRRDGGWRCALCGSEVNEIHVFSKSTRSPAPPKNTGEVGVPTPTPIDWRFFLTNRGWSLPEDEMQSLQDIEDYFSGDEGV